MSDTLHEPWVSPFELLNTYDRIPLICLQYWGLKLGSIATGVMLVECAAPS